MDIPESSDSSLRLKDGERIVIPLSAEEIEIGTEQIVTGKVRLHKSVLTDTIHIDEPGYVERVDVQRFPKDQLLDSAPEIRYEGETMIIPVVQEVIVIQKRLLLREEVHVTRQKIATHHPMDVELRRESLEVERQDNNRSSADQRTTP